MVFYLNLEVLLLRYHIALLLGFRDPAYLKPIYNVFRKPGHLKTHRAVWYAVQTKGVMLQSSRYWLSCRRLCNAKKEKSQDGFKCPDTNKRTDNTSILGFQAAFICDLATVTYTAFAFSSRSRHHPFL
jgi:hypothetical protein